MNRFAITQANLVKTKAFLNGKLAKSAAPKYAQKFGSEMKIVNGKVTFQGRTLIPKEEVEKIFRKAVYKKGSRIPLNRDGGFSAIYKEFWGISRRAWDLYLKKQSKLRSTDRALPQPKKSGKPARNLFEFETDLLEVRTSQMPDTLKDIENSYIITTVHRTTGLTNLKWVKNKEPATVTPKLIEQLEWFAKILKIPISQYVLASDSGFEFDSKVLLKRKIKHRVQKIAWSVEARNGVARRQLFKVLNMKRGSFLDSLKQTQNIINNLKSKVMGVTPAEAIKLSRAEILRRFNSKRQKASVNNQKDLKVGDSVRRTLRSKKDVMYKSNSGVQWDKKKYKILGVSRKVPKSYKLQITEKIKNVKTTHYKWFPRADLQLLPEHDDAWSSNFLRKRLQTGELAKDKPVPKPRKPKAKESKAQKKIKKIKQVEQKKKQTKQLLKMKIMKKI